MSPFTESEAFPRGRRVLLVPVAMLLLIGPYGAMLGGGPADPLRWAVAMLSIMGCTVLLALGVAVPRRRITIDPQARTVTISSTPPPPRFGQIHELRSFDDATGVEVRMAGPGERSGPAYRAIVTFRGAPDLHLRPHATREAAQDTVDRLVLLGLPGHSRAAEREALLDAPKPITWL